MSYEVSVVIPTYNRADLLPHTLDSILRQTRKPAEVIVVDDGSTDNTQGVVARYRPKVRYLRIENSGVCRARNAGVAAATAPWLAFCDSDDLWHEERLALHLQMLQKAPDVAYGFTNFKIVMDGEWSATTKFDTSPRGYWELHRRDLTKDFFIIDESLFERLLVHQPVFVSTLLMTRDFFEAVGKWEESIGRVLSEDLEFHLRCVSRPPIGVLCAPLVGIRKHPDSVSARPFETTLGEIQILRYVLEHHPAAKEHKRAICEQIILRSAIAAEGAFAAGLLDKARELLAAVPRDRRSGRLRVKAAIARLPRPLARLARETALEIGNWKRRLS